MNLKSLCRICLRIPKNSVNIFVNNDALLHKINSISSVKIEIYDGLPENICEECIKNVDYVHNFQKLIEHTDYDLKARLHTLTYTNHLIKPSKIRSIDVISTTTYNEMGILDISIENRTTQQLYEDNKCDIKIEKEFQTNSTKTCETTQRIFRCSRCDAQFLSNNQLNAHRAKNHTPLRVCTICGAKSREDNLKHHMATHSPPKACNACGKILKNASSLRYHFARKHGKPKKDCQICGKSFVLSNDYKRHYLRHTDPDLAYQLEVKPCSLCGKKVRGMKKHMLTHTGERPHICPYCDKGFQGKYGLKVHIRQHTNERPYVCEHCGDGFAQTVSLRTHLKSKHGISKN